MDNYVEMDNEMDNEKIRCRGILHIVKKGDTLYKIAKKYGVPLSRVMYANPYVDVYNLQIGSEICVPVMGPRPPIGNHPGRPCPPCGNHPGRPCPPCGNRPGNTCPCPPNGNRPGNTCPCPPNGNRPGNTCPCPPNGNRPGNTCPCPPNGNRPGNPRPPMGGNRPRSIEMPSELSPLNPVQPDLLGQNESFTQTRNKREENLAGGMRSMPGDGINGNGGMMPGDGMNGNGGMMPGDGMNGNGGMMPGDGMNGNGGMMPGDGINGNGGMMPRDGIDNMHMQPMPADVTAGRGMRSRPEQSEMGENIYGEPDRSGMRTMPDGSITRLDSSMYNAMPEEDMYTMPDGSMRTTPDGDMRTRPDSRMYTTPDGSMRMMPEGPNAHTDLRMVPEQDLRAMPYSDSMGTGRHINPENNGMQPKSRMMPCPNGGNRNEPRRTRDDGMEQGMRTMLRNNGMQCSRCMPAEAWQHAGRMRMPASENQAGGSYMPYADQMYTSSDQMVQNGMQGTADHMMQGEMQGLSEQRMQDGMQQGTSDRMMQDGMGQGTSDRMMQDRMNGYAQDYPDETADTAVDYNSMNLMRQEPGDLSEGNMMADQPMGELRPMGFGSVKAYAEAGRTARKNALPWENTGVSSQMMQDYLAQI